MIQKSDNRIMITGKNTLKNKWDENQHSIRILTRIVL